MQKSFGALDKFVDIADELAGKKSVVITDSMHKNGGRAPTSLHKFANSSFFAEINEIMDKLLSATASLIVAPSNFDFLMLCCSIATLVK